MNESQSIGVNSSSIIDLKAELYRKQESFRLKKLSQIQTQFVENDNNLYAINKSLNSYKLGKRIREKSEKELNKSNELKRRHEEIDHKLIEQRIEDEKALKKSKEMLEFKSKLYEKWSQNPNLLISGENEDNDEELEDRILVDFHRKALDDRQYNRHKNNFQNNPNNDEMNYEKGDEEEEEEWTEFVDSLGRSRRCLKKDLQHYIDVDRQTFHKNRSNDYNKSVEKTVSQFSSVPHLTPNNELLTNDLRRELERQEWETNASNEVMSGSQTDNTNIHYQNVQFNEIRDHGVAYYSFDKDQQKRMEQMELLNHLRDQTKSQKLQKQKLKQKRKQLMRERLTKIAQRKGISVDFKDSSSDSEDEESNDIQAPEPELKPMPTSVREWDVGKEDLPLILPQFPPKQTSNANNSYITERRVERNPEFAPPLSYNKNQFKNNFRDKRTDYKRELTEQTKLEEKTSKFTNISHNLNETIDNRSPVNTDSNTVKADVDQLIGNALSFFRNNLK